MSTATAVTSGVQSLWATLAGLPQPLWADAVPLRSAAGTAVAPPYAVAKAEVGGETIWLADLDRVEAVSLTVEMWHPTKAGADAACELIQYGGKHPAERGGLDDALSLTLPTGYRLNKVDRTGPAIVAQEELHGPDAGPVFRSTIPYRAEIFITGDGRA